MLDQVSVIVFSIDIFISEDFFCFWISNLIGHLGLGSISFLSYLTSFGTLEYTFSCVSYIILICLHLKLSPLFPVIA
jgi:hypothetical protein